MADQKITDLTATTVLVGTDLMCAVRDVSGTPVSRKVSVTSLFAALDADIKLTSGKSFVLKNNDWIKARDAANTTDIELFKLNANDQLAIGGSIKVDPILGTIILSSGANIELNNTMLGTTALQLIGFWGATPVAQPTTIADADGTLADLTTKFNTLLAKLETIGLLASA